MKKQEQKQETPNLMEGIINPTENQLGLNQEQLKLQAEMLKQGQKKEVDPPKPKFPKLRIGIISTPVYRVDLMEFNSILTEITEELEKDITLVVFGYDGTDDFPVMKGLVYEHYKLVNMIQYFKQLKALNLDCVLVPLMNNLYNATSENFNKYLEAAAFSIPLVVTDIYPYNSLIKDGTNGFLFKEKESLMAVVKYLLSNRHMTKYAGENAHMDLLENFDFTEENIEMLSDAYN